MKNQYTLLNLIIFISISTPVYADSNFQCMDTLKSLKFAFQGVKDRNLTYSLKQNGQTRYTLFVSAYDETEQNRDGVAIMPWRLLERQGDSHTYCLIAAGTEVERLMDMHDAPGSENKYGMPGSGYQRCTDSSGGIAEALGLRIWANKELGNSYIQHFTSEIGNYDFTLLNSTEGQGGKISWILLSTKKVNPYSSCYYARGDDAALHPNFKTPDSMDFDVPKINGLKY